MKSYDDIFQERGSAYDRAMRAQPHARSAEFRQAVQRAQLSPGQVVADVPAGGGYLREYLPSGCHWRGHEPCTSFSAPGGHHRADPTRSLLPLPWSDASVDAILSIAGVHHLDVKVRLFGEFRRVIRPGGRLVLSDVAAGSDVARFLDGYVGAHNSTGHEGVFLDRHSLHELREAGWIVQSDELVDFHWVFDDRQALADFCHGLFDLRRASPAKTLAAIEDGLGIDTLPDGRAGMRWQLRTITAQSPGSA